MLHSMLLRAPALAFSAALLTLAVPALLARAAGEQRVYLPIAAAPPLASGIRPVPPGSPPEQAARDRINQYRVLAGSPPLELHPSLVAAAQRHATYTTLNYRDPSAWANGPHGEVAGKPAYSGATSAERALAAGFPHAATGEVIDHFDDPLQSVDALMATVFHRKTILAPAHQYVGYGGGRSADDEEAVDVIAFGSGPARPPGPAGVLVFPAAGQTGVPLYGTSETPSYLPPGAAYPAGYPVTVQLAHGRALAVTSAELRDGRGALTPLHPSPAACGSGCYALTPQAGLQPATTYTARVAGAVDGAPFDTTWTFTTQP